MGDLAPPGRIAEASSAAAIGVFGRFVLGPILFVEVAASSGFAAALWIPAVSAVLSLAAWWRRSNFG